MGRILAAVAGILAVACCLSDAFAQQAQFPCDAFRRNSDGSLSVVKDATVQGPNGTSVPIGPGMSLPQGVNVDFMGVDLAALHEKNCR